MKTVVLAALVGLISWQALASTPDTKANAPCPYRSAGTTFDKAKTDWSSFYQDKSTPYQRTRQPERTAQAQGSDNRG